MRPSVRWMWPRPKRAARTAQVQANADVGTEVVQAQAQLELARAGVTGGPSPAGQLRCVPLPMRACCCVP